MTGGVAWRSRVANAAISGARSFCAITQSAVGRVSPGSEPPPTVDSPASTVTLRPKSASACAQIFARALSDSNELQSSARRVYRARRRLPDAAVE